MYAFTGRLGLSFGVWAFLACHAYAQPIIYQATGTREQIQPTIDQFKHDIVYGPGGSEQNPPPFLGSFKVATFDDVRPALTERYVSQFASGGLLFFGGPSSGPYISTQSQAFSA